MTLRTACDRRSTASLRYALRTCVFTELIERWSAVAISELV